MYLQFTAITNNLHQMQTLEELKKHFINELVHQDLRRVFYILRQNIDNERIKYDDLNLLHARYITASHDQNIKGILSSEDARLIFNQINAALLDFINELTDKDLNLKPSAAPVPIPTQVKEVAQKTTCNKGKILYKVPDLMELKKERKCIVRIAFDEKELEINDLQSEGSKVEPIRIAEVMEVQFIDQGKDDTFNIRTLSSSEQLVDRGDFTEWIFYVEPLLQGVYDLLLKVSVIEKRMGREIRKDIVMEKKIEVVANPVDEEDSIGSYVSSEHKMAIGAGFVIPSGFEIWDQPVILDSFFIPPLDPGANPPTPTPPPYLPPKEVNSIGWLIFATIALLTVVGYLWNDPISPPHLTPHGLIINDSINNENDALTLTVKGQYPPFELTIINKDDTSFFLQKNLETSGANDLAFTSLGLMQGVPINFEATLKDSRDNHIVAELPIHWKIPTYDSPLRSVIGIKVAPTSNQKALNLAIINGIFPFQVTIINKNDKSKKWPFTLLKARDTSLLFQSFKNFPEEGNFIVEVADVSHRMASDNFSLTEKDELTLNAKVDKKAKNLKVSMKGNRPPFIVFLDKNRIAKLEEEEGSHSIKLSDDHFKNKRKIEVMIKDANGNFKNKVVKINTEITNIPLNTPDSFEETLIVGNDCLDPQKFKNKCTVVYVFNEITTDNWKMRNKTFSSSKITQRIKQEKFDILRFNLKGKASNCNNLLFSNLKDANTFVFQGNNQTPISYKGYVDSDKLLSSLVCHDSPPPPDIVTPILTSKGDGKSLKIQLDPVKAYRYNTLKGNDISIEKQQTEKYRVQIISFEDERFFNLFIKDIENRNDIKEPLFIRLEDTFIKVYLGDYEQKAKADQLLIDLKIYLRKNNLVKDDEYIRFMRVVKN